MRLKLPKYTLNKFWKKLWGIRYTYENLNII